MFRILNHIADLEAEIAASNYTFEEGVTGALQAVDMDA